MDAHHVNTGRHRLDGLVGIASIATARYRLVLDLLEEIAQRAHDATTQSGLRGFLKEPAIRD